MELTIGDLANRSISTLIKYQGRGDLINIMDLADRDGFNLHFTNVPADFSEPLNDLFDPVYMKRLYEVGYRKGLSESAWYSGFMDVSTDCLSCVDEIRKSLCGDCLDDGGNDAHSGPVLGTGQGKRLLGPVTK